MNRSELKLEFDDLGVPEEIYDLEGSASVNDAFVIEKNYHRWTVFYQERGKRSDEKGFSNEHEACLYMRILVLKASETYIKYHNKHPENNILD